MTMEFTLSDLIVLGSAAVAAAIIIAASFGGRRAFRIEDILSRKLENLVEGYSCTDEALYHVKVGPYAIEGLESSEWTCCKLGCGGWGCAYRCEDSSKRVVVFKVPRGYESIVERNDVPSVDRRLLERVVNEASMVKKLDHPHIVKLLAYSPRVPLLVYEYADGGSLGYQLSRGWRPSIRDVVVIGVQLADALRYIHSRGLVHGDIKVGNVFIVNGVAKLGDFSSVVKLLSETSHHSKYGYTVGWRAPEQVYADLRKKAAERGLENRIDVYQLGNLLLYLLTGETIDGEDAVKLRDSEKKLNNVRYPKLRALLKRMLTYEPSERPSSEEVLKELLALANELLR